MDYPKSILLFENYKITESIFRSEDNAEDNELKIELNNQIKTHDDVGESDSKRFVQSILSIHLLNEANTLELKTTIVGNFSIENTQNAAPNEIAYLSRTSTTTILFPYLRSYISTITTAAGINPIVLPLINISKAIEFEDE